MFLFRDVEQMKDFLVGYCYRDRDGRVWLHHGIRDHEFTELAAEYYVNVPDGIKWLKNKRKNFMMGMCNSDILIEGI